MRTPVTEFAVFL